MTGFTPQSGQVGFKTQPTKGTFSPPGTGGIFMRLTGGSLSGKRNMIVPTPEIGGNRDIPDAYLGSIIFAGQYDFYCRSDSLPTLLYAALGAKVDSATGTGTTLVGTHTLTPSDAIPWLSIEEKVANGYEVFNYTDAKINTLHLDVVAEDYIKGTVTLAALTQTSGNTATVTPDWDLTPLIVGTNVIVNYNSVALPAKKWSIDINNNLEENDFRLGSVFAGDVVPKRRDINTMVTIRPNDDLIWKQATYGSSAATSAIGGAAPKQATTVVATTYEVIGTTVTPYSITLSAPKAAIKPFEIKVSGDTVIEHDIDLQLLRPDPTVDICSFVVVNHRAATL